MANGKAGPPLGNDNAARGNEWHLAIKRALARKGEGDYRRGLDKLADKVVEAAASGDGRAWQDIADRFDGKPRQSIEATGLNGGPIEHKVTAEWVIQPVKPAK